MTAPLCRSCGRPRSPDHDADAPGPTARHPFIADTGQDAPAPTAARPRPELLGEMRETATRLQRGFAHVAATLHGTSTVASTGRAFRMLGEDMTRFGELVGEWAGELDR